MSVLRKTSKQNLSLAIMKVTQDVRILDAKYPVNVQVPGS